MNNEIKKIVHEDEMLIHDKLYKIITVEFNELDKIEVQNAELMNIEIETELAKEYSEDGSLDRTDTYFPTRLGKAKYNRDRVGLKLRFEMGRTLFNSGAMLLMTIKHDDRQEVETVVYSLMDNQWKFVENCDTIDYNTVSHKKYKLIDTEWVELGDNNGNTNIR